MSAVRASLLELFGIRPRAYATKTYHDRRDERHRGIDLSALRKRRGRNKVARRSRRVNRIVRSR